MFLEKELFAHYFMFYNMLFYILSLSICTALNYLVLILEYNAFLCYLKECGQLSHA